MQLRIRKDANNIINLDYNHDLFADSIYLTSQDKSGWDLLDLYHDGANVFYANILFGTNASDVAHDENYVIEADSFESAFSAVQDFIQLLRVNGNIEQITIDNVQIARR